MTKDWLLTSPKRAAACCESRTRLPLHPTGCLAGRFAPCLVCDRLRGRRAGPGHAGLGLELLLRRAAGHVRAATSGWALCA
jgi:hypothetical protein